MVKHINETEFAALKSEPIALVDFSATWCGPCKMLAPVLDGISDLLGDKLKFYNVDVDECGDVAQKFGIISVPTLVVLKNGKEVARQVGFQPGPALKSWIESALSA